MATTDTTVLRSQIQGWGADLDPANRPAVPMEHMPPRLDVPWDRPPRQRQDVEILMSVEHEEMPPVFGTTVPPSGLSGMIRRAAFKLSENDIRHWLMLLFADRVNMVEGILDDLRHGHVPNIYAERGWSAKFRYDRAAAIRNTIIGAAAIGFIAYRLTQRRSED